MRDFGKTPGKKSVLLVFLSFLMKKTQEYSPAASEQLTRSESTLMP